MSRPMYAYGYAHAAFDDAIAILAEDPRGLLQSATDTSMERADEVVTNLHVDVAGFDLGRDVVVEFGDFQPVEAMRCVLPVSWRAASGHLLFPTVEATLEISALSLHPPMVQVTLAGSYEPPLGAVGGVVDRALTHRMAEAVIHRFVEDVTDRLEARVATLSADEKASILMSSALELDDTTPAEPI